MLNMVRAQLSVVGLLLLAACAAQADTGSAAADSSADVARSPLALSAAGASAPPEPQADAGVAQTGTSPWDYFRELRRLQWWRWHRRWHPTHSTGGAGDGQDQDGGMPIQDNTATPGDDRPGFVSCPGSDNPALVCSPEQRCCRSPEITCDSVEQDCQRPDVTVGWGDNCDGPEDCEAGLTCVRGKYGASCTPANPQQGYPVLCHADLDCAFIPESACRNDGICAKF